jgi:5-methylcytosine-specific restriction enzyme subunit McrC
MPRGEKWQSERSLIMDALNALDSVKPSRMRFGEDQLASTVPMWIRDYYRGALTVYAVLLGYTQVGFAYNARGSEMPSFLFCLDDIFEAFVRNTLREGLRAEKLSVVDGNKKDHQRPLFTDNKQFPTKPDTIIRRGKDTRAIGEVKYKPKIEEEDRYQVISHVVAARAPVGIWISPALSEDRSGMEYVGAIATGAKFYHYRLNIAADLDVASKDMVSAISKLVV